MSRLRIAVIGAGHLGKIHTRLIGENDRADLIGVVDPDQEAAGFAASESSTQAFSDIQKVVNRIDAAIVAAPTVAHEEIACDLIAAGVHVFVEKPITVTPLQANRLIEAARKRGVILQVGHVEQFNPAWQAGVEHVQHPSYLSAHRCSPFSFRSTDISVVHDLMIHDIELVLSVAESQVTEIRAWGQRVLTDFEDIATAWIKFEDGPAVNLTASRVHHDQVRQMHICEDNHQLVIDFAAGSVTSVDAGTVNGSLSACTPEELYDLRQAGKESVMSVRNHDVPAGNAIVGEHDDFIDSILNHRQPRVSGQRGRDALELAERIVAEIRRNTGRVRLRTAA